MTERHLTYVIGEPGVGKSTLLQTLTRSRDYADFTKPFAHRIFQNGVVLLGRQEGDYPGTDTLAFNVKATVLDYLKDRRPPMVLGEGARLANVPFFTGAEALGYTLHVYHLVGKARAAERRGTREKPQADTYAAGRRTSAAAVAEAVGALDIYTSMPPEFLVRMMTDPVSLEFR